ncbi:carboxylating nicotinate-nucleotide diphosphorylase [Helicobacter sp. 16-1353]|uniref:carboxylating nicotinate-nucleotide diphosphorylase n=1 Tax=Helicobacter sp. 16-1353 TaxID=2004996 RepID=UPI0015EED5CE|nr:carboxylating nicotinate-nucleotide diphosphorylase [Helicobacter sp. 16-1353]
MREFVENALREDLGRGDLFERVLGESALGSGLQNGLDLANFVRNGANEIENDSINGLRNKKVTAKILAKEDGILSGRAYVEELFGLFSIESRFHLKDGAEFVKGAILCEIKGAYVDILKVERTALNILQHSSGIATNTAKYVNVLRENDLNTTLLDTRKTRPLLRAFEKYSVLNGGGRNHRFGLDECLMLKDTHLRHIKDLAEFIKIARAKIPWSCKIEVECEDFKATKRAMESGCDIVMCDNMKPSEIAKVVEYRNNLSSGILIEASGNVSENNIVEIAKSGVDAISVGSLIHHAVWVDLSMRMD